MPNLGDELAAARKVLQEIKVAVGVCGQTGSAAEV